MNSARRILETSRSSIDLLTRQISIQTSQPLRNIAERRCLLNALQKFGEVATFLPAKDGDKSAILVIYETPEAASRAIHASPLTVLLPLQSHSSGHSRAKTSAHDEHSVKASIHPNTAFTISEHENRIGENPWNNFHTGYKWQQSQGDARIRDVIHARAPRRVFADGAVDTSYLRSGKDDTVNTGSDKREKVELKGSLLALLGGQRSDS